MNGVDVLGVIGIFFLPIIMVILIVWFKTKENGKRDRLQAELYAKAIEKGIEVPPGLFVPVKKEKKPLNTGIICISVGLGVSLFLWLVTPGYGHPAQSAAALGIIPFFIGLGYLIIHFIEKKKSADENVR